MISGHIGTHRRTATDYQQYLHGTFLVYNQSSENCAILGFYTASNGNFLPTFRDNLSVPTSGCKNPTNMDWMLLSTSRRIVDAGGAEFESTDKLNSYFIYGMCCSYFRPGNEKTVQPSRILAVRSFSLAECNGHVERVHAPV